MPKYWGLGLQSVTGGGGGRHSSAHNSVLSAPKFMSFFHMQNAPNHIPKVLKVLTHSSTSLKSKTSSKPGVGEPEVEFIWRPQVFSLWGVDP